MSECSHNCSDCAENCSERTEIQKEKPHKLSRIRKVIAVVSGKGGVGKSLVTGLLAVNGSGRMLSGTTWIICSSTCRRAPATCR